MISKFSRNKINGGLEGIIKRVRAPGFVDVGVIDAGTHADGDLTVASIAFQNEFGTKKIPARPFIRSTLFEKHKDIIAMQKKLMIRIVDGDIGVEKALGVVGKFMAAAISQKIITIKTPPNADWTLEQKYPKTNPLVDTGQLESSITYVVNRNA